MFGWMFERKVTGMVCFYAGNDVADMVNNVNDILKCMKPGLSITLGEKIELCLIGTVLSMKTMNKVVKKVMNKHDDQKHDNNIRYTVMIECYESEWEQVKKLPWVTCVSEVV